MQNKFKKYIPSKKFLIALSIGACLLLAIFLISRFSKSTNFKTKNGLMADKTTLNDLLQKDTDGDGVMDWEEALWGTDINAPTTFDGEPDSSYIRKKREALKAGDNTVYTDAGTETDKFTQEFFTSFLALKQSGKFDANTINNLYGTVGEKIADANLIDSYKIENLIINENTGASAQKKYYDKLASLFGKYSEMGIGDELEIVSGDLSEYSSTGQAGSADELSKIAGAYKEFAQKMSELSTPQSLVSHHLKILNDANNTGIAVANMEKMIADPIIGLSGLSQYQKYSDDFINSVNNLTALLINNGIITE